MEAVVQAAYHTLFHFCEFQEQTYLERNQNYQLLLAERLLMRRENEGAVWDAINVLYLHLI